jgi:hypothetical protein
MSIRSPKKKNPRPKGREPYSRGTTLLAPRKRGLSVGDTRSPRPDNRGRARLNLLGAMDGWQPSLRSASSSGGIFDAAPAPGSHLSRALWAGTLRLLVSIIAFEVSPALCHKSPRLSSTRIHSLVGCPNSLARSSSESTAIAAKIGYKLPLTVRPFGRTRPADSPRGFAVPAR